MKQLNRLDIREIRESTVVFNDGNMAAVLELKIPEFKNMTKKEQKEIIANYRLWLWTLDHPVQITARTVNMETKEKLEIMNAKVEQRFKTKEFNEAMMEYNRFYKWLKEKAIDKSRRKYYVVIPYSPLYTKKRELKKLKGIKENLGKLRLRVNRTQQMLLRCKIIAKRMGDEELTNLYSSYYAFSYYNGKYERIETCLEEWREAK